MPTESLQRLALMKIPSECDVMTKVPTGFVQILTCVRAGSVALVYNVAIETPNIMQIQPVVVAYLLEGLSGLCYSDPMLARPVCPMLK